MIGDAEKVGSFGLASRRARRDATPGLLRTLRWGVLLCLALAVLVGCVRERKLSLEGEWTLSGPASAGVGRQESVYSSWRFEDGAVTARACCTPGAELCGSYRVLQSGEDSVVLGIDIIDGESAGDGLQVVVVWDSDEDALLIQGIGPYYRVE